MKTPKRLLLPLAVSAFGMATFCASSGAWAQQSGELDLTIRVLEQGETPAGFVNRLQIPAPESLVDANVAIAVQAQTEMIEDTLSASTDAVNDATQNGTDNVREALSIDGTVNIDLGGANGITGPLIPPAIVQILDPALPLVDSLLDTAEQIGDGIVDGLPVDDLLDDGGLIDDVVDDVTGPVGGIVDNLDSAIAVDALDDVGAGVISDSSVTGVIDALPLESIPAVDSVPELPVSDLPVLDLPASDIPLDQVLAPLSEEMLEVPELPLL